MLQSAADLVLIVLVCALVVVYSQAPPPAGPPAQVQPIQNLRPHQIAPSGHRHAVRCYICQWSVAQCSDFNCYNNPDTCTNNNFSPSLVQVADCPGGCEQFVITDPNGLVQQWRRNCAPGTTPTTGFNCRTEYQFGIRIDRCICNRDWCNSSLHLHVNNVIVIACLIITFLIYTFC